MTIWFTSDTHFGHTKIVELAHRPFATIEEHDEVLIKNWNERVRPKDTVYHLGDFGLARRDYLREVRQRLNGNIHLILGNHDSEAERPGLRETFQSQRDMFYLKQKLDGRAEKIHIHLCHYPLVSWCESNHGSWHLHGHHHGNLLDDPRLLRVDIGVDHTNFVPVSLHYVVGVMESRIANGAGPVERHSLCTE